MRRRETLELLAGLLLAGTCVSRTASAADRLPKRLLLVHGRGQQGLHPKDIEQSWLTALKRGATALHQELPADVNVSLPFYGDKLNELTTAFNIPLTSTIHARGTTSDQEDFLAFQAEFAEALRLKAGITDAAVDAEYTGGPGERGPLNWAWVQAILRAIDKNGHGMNEKTLELFTRDVFLYTTKAGVRDTIDQIVGAELTEEPTVIVAHSLGTVVTYSILSRDRRNLMVPQLVTVGCPLAVRAVRDQFRPLQSPTAVKAWYNAFDKRDVVALYPLDATNFPVTPDVENYSGVRNHTDNRHGIDGYLDDPKVAARILDALAGRPPG